MLSTCARVNMKREGKMQITTARGIKDRAGRVELNRGREKERDREIEIDRERETEKKDIKREVKR